MDKKNKLLVLVIILGLFVLILIGYIYYDKGLIGNKKTESSSSDTKNNVTEKNGDNITSNQTNNNNTMIYRLSSCKKKWKCH